PARGTYSVSMEAFDEAFTGVCLMMEPGEGFVPSGKPRSMLRFAAGRLRGAGAAVAFAVLTGIILSLAELVSPVFSRVFLDRILTHRNPDWITPFFILWGALFALRVLMSAIRTVYDLRINGKMAAVGNASYMWQVLKMPMSFFSQRMAGDIQGRKGSNAAIAETLINTFAPLALQCVMMVFYLVVMLRYSWLLTLVGLVSLTLNAILSDIVSKKRVNLTRVAMRDSAKLASSTVAGIEMIETIKAAGAEEGYFGRWAGYQASVNAQDVRVQKLSRYLGMVPAIVSNLANDAILILGVYLTFKGEFTVGMVMAFQGFLASFMAPASMLISAGQTLQEMRTEMERVDDVMEYPTPVVFAPEGREEEYKKLSGRVELKNVVFGYSALAEPLITDFSLTVEPGKTVAIVGASGCGKSTVSKLITGLYQPWSGEILFDGKPMKEIDRGVFAGSVAVVDQDIILFEDTIENNIKMWDESIEDFEMILAARDAQIHEDIMLRPDGYQHKLIEGGRDFSGGQRQRMEIARVLASDPTVIILDEATSALDARTEYEVVKAIRARGITCIVIAHRLSTIRSADEIIVMEKGVISCRGTHEELLRSSPLYHDLVANE
ncbi:MAG: peptidase domain-containing ABC transporter, partial [Clostridia bacterium]|nr:peptidase domain-containing ABC transporter [Clostridia bacterium]